MYTVDVDQVEVILPLLGWSASNTPAPSVPQRVDVEEVFDASTVKLEG